MKVYNTAIITIVIICILLGCKHTKKEINVESVKLEKGTFGYDEQFLQKYYKNSLTLSIGEAKVIVIPELQGRIMTSSAEGNLGTSFGWINYDFIEEGKVVEHFNPIGGEERFWLGPEGGQFSVYFKPESTFEFENWYVPKELDTEPFDLVSYTDTEAHFKKQIKLLNFSKTTFNMQIDRVVRLLNESDANLRLGVSIPEGLKMVSYESENMITNIGENEWNKDSGMLSVWILSMLKHSDKTVVVAPFKAGEELELGDPVTKYASFGELSSDRLVIKDSVLFFKVDGKKRSKIGVSPKRALPIIGSYDPIQSMLTIVEYTLDEGNHDYVNSLWEMQEDPFSGDVVNSYNDGVLEDGSQLGPFYELESSSPAANLKKGESITHIHRTFHFKGPQEQLNYLAEALLNTSLSEITTVFK